MGGSGGYSFERISRQAWQPPNLESSLEQTRQQAAEAEVDRVFKAHDVPSDVPEFVLHEGDAEDGRIELARVLNAVGLVNSNREGRRQISGGAVRIDGERVDDPETIVQLRDVDGRVIQVGRKKWARIRVVWDGPDGGSKS